MDQSNLTTRQRGLRRGLFQSIRMKLIVNFSVLFTITLAAVVFINTFGVPFTSYKGRRGQRRSEAFKGMSLIADLKKERILRWIADINDDIHVFSENALVVFSAVKLCDEIGNKQEESAEATKIWAALRSNESYRALKEFLLEIRSTYEAYDKIQVADAEQGTVLFSTDERDLGADIFQWPPFMGALESRNNYVGEIELSPTDRAPVLHISHVVKEKGGDVVAVMILQVNAEDILTPMLHTGEGLGERGEALLVNQEKKILTSLKHPLPDKREARPLEYQIKAKPAVLAAEGEEGIIEGFDYRGVPVLAAFRHIRVSSEWGWGLVVKSDKAELFEPMRKDMNYSFLIGLFGVLAVVLLTIFSARNLAGPIRSLSRTAKRIEKGELQARAPVTSLDEVGNLAMTFNAMLTRLEGWHRELEAQVQARTSELNRANEELKKEIAERKRAEDELRVSEERFDIAVQGSNDGLWDWPDIRREKMWFSTRLFEMLGYEVGAFDPGFTMFKGLLHPEDSDMTLDSMDAHFEKRVPYDVEYRLRTKSGGYIWCRARGRALRNEKGEPMRMAGSIQNITERKTMEMERESLISELEAKNTELEQFTYTVSHDLKSPLITIRGFSGLLEKDLQAGNAEQVKEDLARISDAAEKMQLLLEKLLELSRTGRLLNPPEDISLGPLVREALSMCSGLWEAGAVQVEIAPDMPVVRGDRLRVREVLENLISNAAKAMEDQPDPRIEIGTRQEDEACLIYVRDNGKGIDPRYHNKIFGLFEKLDPKTEGTGVGLAIVKRIVEVHEGRIWVESAGLGKGATFYFTLPGGGNTMKKKEITP